MVWPVESFFTRAEMEVVSSVERGSKSVIATTSPCVQLGVLSEAWQGLPVVMSVQLVGACDPSLGVQLRRIGSKSWLLRLNWQVSPAGQSVFTLQVVFDRVTEQTPLCAVAPLMLPMFWLLQNRPPTQG